VCVNRDIYNMARSSGNKVSLTRPITKIIKPKRSRGDIARKHESSSMITMIKRGCLSFACFVMLVVISLTVLGIVGLFIRGEDIRYEID
jgi:hypothetical protein